MNPIRALFNLSRTSLLVTLTFAQQSPSDHQQVVVNVRDASGGFVLDLAPSSFRASVGGHDVTVSSVNASTGNNRLIVVLDASGSMSDRELWTAAKGLVDQIIAAAPASTQLALLVFDARILHRLDFSHSRKELVTVVEGLPEPRGHTALWNSLLEASQMFDNPRPGDAVLVVSDGGDNANQATPQKVERVYLSKRIRIFGVNVEHGRFLTEEEREGYEDFSAVIKHTGGDTAANMTRFHKDPADFFKQFFDELGHFYVLDIDCKPLPKPERLNLSIVVNGRKEKGVDLAYPQQLPSGTP